MSASRSDPPGIFSAFVLRRMLLVLVPSMLLVAAVVTGLYLHDREMEIAVGRQAGKHVVELQAEIINREFATVASDLQFLANQGVLRDLLSNESTPKETLEKEYSLFAQKRAVYDQIRYLDAAGQERIRVNYADGKPIVVPAEGLQSKANRYYFSRTMTLDRGDMFVSPFDLNVEQDEIERPLKPMVRFATPVFDDHGKKQGILILNYLGAALIRKLAEVSVSIPGSTYLVNRDGYFLRGPTPEDEWGFMLGHDRTFGAYYPQEWDRVKDTTAGQFQTARGLFTFRNISADLTSVPGDRVRARLPSVVPPTSEPRDPDAGDSGLIVMSWIPPDTLDRQSTTLLRRLLIFSIVLLSIVAALAWYLAHAGALRSAQEQQLAASEGRLRILSSQLMSAQEEERRKISRDLHDDLGQVATSVALDLQRAAQAADAKKKEELIGHALVGTERLLAGIHEISGRIRPTILDDLGLKDAVQNLLSDFERNTGIIPRASLELKPTEITGKVAENIYRILQECLTNVAKHAQTQEVEVALTAANNSAVLVVRDRGRGFSTDLMNGNGLGLLGMRERAELLGGTVSISSAPGQGTQVTASIPLSQDLA